jgi:hypothetical protein
MTMAYVEPDKILYPRYRGTVRCQNCGAEYSKGGWVYGYYDEGTSNRFNVIGRIGDNVCPNCRAKNNLPYPKVKS